MVYSLIRSGPQVYRTVRPEKTTRWQFWSTIQPEINQSSVHCAVSSSTSLPSKVHERLKFHDDENLHVEDQNTERILLRDTFDFLFSNASSLPVVSEMLQRPERAGASVVSPHLNTDKWFSATGYFYCAI